MVIILFKPATKKWENYFSDVKYLKKLNIAYAGTNRHFQLYDKNLNFNVYYINVDRNQDLKWDKEKNIQYRKLSGNFSVWLKNIHKKDIDYFVLNYRELHYIENQWIQKHPGLFPRETQNIFKVNKNAIKSYLKGEK